MDYNLLAISKMKQCKISAKSFKNAILGGFFAHIAKPLRTLRLKIDD